MQQRDLILNLLEESDDALTQDVLTRDDGEALFVKNLENVQGDERDSILFSLAFSKDPDHRTAAAQLRPTDSAGRRAPAERGDHAGPVVRWSCSARLVLRTCLSHVYAPRLVMNRCTMSTASARSGPALALGSTGAPGRRRRPARRQQCAHSQHPWPPDLEIPPDWTAGYEAIATTLAFPVTDVNEAADAVRDYIERIAEA